MRVATKRCAGCQLDLPEDEFRYVPSKGRLSSRCHICKKKYGRIQDPRMKMYKSAQNRARVKCWDFDIDPEDIVLVEHCPYLGIKIHYGCVTDRRAYCSEAPSLDRIDSSRGYVKDNIQVISNLANRMKANATIEQLVAFAHGVLRTHT